MSIRDILALIVGMLLFGLVCGAGGKCSLDDGHDRILRKIKDQRCVCKCPVPQKVDEYP